jgi:hypothetical protein
MLIPSCIIMSGINLKQVNVFSLVSGYQIQGNETNRKKNSLFIIIHCYIHFCPVTPIIECEKMKIVGFQS